MFLTLLALSQFCHAQDSDSAEGVDSTANAADSSDFDYTYLWVIGGQWSDSLVQGGFFGGVFGRNLISDKVALDWQFRGLVRWSRFKARSSKPQLLATPLTLSLGLGIASWTSMLMGDSTIIPTVLFCVLVVPYGCHLAYRPTRDITFYTGVTPEFKLFTDDDGMLFQYRAGLRFRLPDNGAVVEPEAVKSRFWGWEKESQTFGWGFGVNFLIDPIVWPIDL